MESGRPQGAVLEDPLLQRTDHQPTGGRLQRAPGQSPSQRAAAEPGEGHTPPGKEQDGCPELQEKEARCPAGTGGGCVRAEAAACVAAQGEAGSAEVSAGDGAEAGGALPGSHVQPERRGRQAIGRHRLCASVWSQWECHRHPTATRDITTR